MVMVDWMWVLTRVPNAIGSVAHSLLKDTAFKVIKDKRPDYVPETRFRST